MPLRPRANDPIVPVANGEYNATSPGAVEPAYVPESVLKEFWEHPPWNPAPGEGGDDPRFAGGGCAVAVTGVGFLPLNGTLAVFEANVGCVVPARIIEVEVCGQGVVNGHWTTLACSIETERATTEFFGETTPVWEAEATAVSYCTPGEKLRTWGWALALFEPPFQNVPGKTTAFAFSLEFTCPNL